MLGDFCTGLCCVLPIIQTDTENHRGVDRRQKLDHVRLAFSDFEISKNVSANIEKTPSRLLGRKPNISLLRKVSDDPHEEISRRGWRWKQIRSSGVAWQAVQ